MQVMCGQVEIIKTTIMFELKNILNISNVRNRNIK